MSRYTNKLTPSVIGTVVREDGALLLIQRTKEPFVGKWCMPGGKLEVGEHPDQGIVREFEEETGFRVGVQKFCGLVSEVVSEEDGDSHFLLHVFRLEILDGTLIEGGTQEGPLQWFLPEQLMGLCVPSDLWIMEHMLLRENGPKLLEIQSTDTESTIVAQY